MPDKSEIKAKNNPYDASQKARSDGRMPDEMRPIKMEVGVIDRADGSAYVEFGNTHAIAAVYGPTQVHPRHLEDPQKAVITCKYNMIPFSVADRKKPGYDRRSIEISKVIKEALEPAIFTEELPKTMISIEMEIIQADAGTRVTALTAASLALADAGIPMRDMVVAVASGRANGQILVDLTKEEEDAPDAVDMPMAMMPNSGKISLLQMDGDVTPEEIRKILELSKKVCMQIAAKQKEALRKKYEVK